MLSNSAIATVPFERVWSRMTAAEAALALVYADLAASVPAVASHLTAEGGLTAWAWNSGAGTYFSTSPYRYQGGVFSANRRADQVRPLLQASYESDRAAFISSATNSNDARGSALVDEMPPVQPGPPAVTKICWWGPYQTYSLDGLTAYDASANHRSNLVRPVTMFRSGAGLPIIGAEGLATVAQVAAYLAAQPAGCRALNMGDSPGAWGIPVSSGAATGRVAMFEREFDHATRRGIGLTTWQTAMLDPASEWITFWADLLAQGESLLGLGNGYKLLDYLVIDVERAYRFWNLQGGGLGGETWTDIFGDPGWDTLRTTFFLPVLSQLVWNTYATWDFANDERCFAIDAALRADYLDKWAPVAAIATARFPQLRVGDYDHAAVAIGTRPVTSPAAAYATPYGVAGGVGTKSSYASYGADYIAEWRRWHWPTLVEQAGTPGNGQAGTVAQRVWRMMVAHVSMIQSIDSASTQPRESWLSDAHATLTVFGLANDLAMWAELTLHATLAECDVNFYAYDATTKRSQLRAAIDLIAERDQVVGYAGARAEPQAPFDEVDVMRRPYLASKALAGWRWIWRVTPNPFLAAPKIDEQNTSTGPGVTFDWSGGRVLEIPRGTIVRVAGSLATAGYWVEQPLPKRFRYGGSVPVGTDAVQLVPAPLPNWTRRLFVRLDPAATDLVYVGFSAAVNGTKGNANCGWPLDAGEERGVELSRDVDGGDETHVWLQAVSGTQYVTWWAE